MAQAPLIKLAPQLNFMWDELQGPENRTMRMFDANPNMGPGQYASLFEKMYERAGGAGDEIAQKYAADVYSAMQDPAKAETLPSNAKFAYGYLTQKGMSPQQAAGITGRLMVESYPTMDPNARNTMGGGAGTLGVAQWRGPRLEALAKSAGVSMDDIRALPSSTPEGNYYSQTGSGGEKMAGGLLNMMPGATPEPGQAQAQAQPQPQGGGFKDFITSPDFFDSLAIGLGGMTMRPNTGVIEAAQSRMKSRAASRQDTQTRNKTVAWLRANGREDLAGAVESGAIDGKAAVTLAYQEPERVTPMSAIGKLADDLSAGRITKEQYDLAVANMAPQGMAIETTPDGGFRFVQGANAAAKPFTEGQSKDIVYATRAEGALNVLEGMTPEGQPISQTLTSAGQRAANFDPTGLVRGVVQTPEFQVAQQAGQEFLQAILRKDTGAAITPKEQQLYGETFLPQPGDSPQVLATKVQSRQRAIDAIKAGLPPSAIVAQEQALRRNLANERDAKSLTTPDVFKAPDFSKMTDAELNEYILEQERAIQQIGGK